MKQQELVVEVKVFESKMQPKTTSGGGVYQVIGNCHAKISLSAVEATEDSPAIDEVVLFPDFSGRVSRFYKTTEDFNNKTNLRLIMDFGNSYRNGQGAYVPQTLPSEKLQGILEAKTMEAFKRGFSTSERDEANAAAAGMKLEDYTTLMNDALEAASNIGGELEVAKPVDASGKSATQQMEDEIG